MVSSVAVVVSIGLAVSVTPAGVPVAADDQAPLPVSFVALTRSVYAVSLVSELTVCAVVEPPERTACRDES